MLRQTGQSFDAQLVEEAAKLWTNRAHTISAHASNRSARQMNKAMMRATSPGRPVDEAIWEGCQEGGALSIALSN
jgi:hypothetical protein